MEKEFLFLTVSAKYCPPRCEERPENRCMMSGHSWVVEKNWHSPFYSSILFLLLLALLASFSRFVLSSWAWLWRRKLMIHAMMREQKLKTVFVNTDKMCAELHFLFHAVSVDLLFLWFFSSKLRWLRGIIESTYFMYYLVHTCSCSNYCTKGGDNGSSIDFLCHLGLFHYHCTSPWLY